MRDKKIDELVAKAEREEKKLVGKPIDFSYVEELLEVSKSLLKPKGVFRKRCPDCGTKLDWVDIDDPGALELIYRYFECPNCDYWYIYLRDKIVNFI